MKPSCLNTLQRAKRPSRSWFALALLVAALTQATAATPEASGPSPTPLTIAQVLSSLRPDLERVADSESLARATAALTFAAEMKLPQASKAINEALQLDPSNSYLHFFNGLIYHIQARQGDTDKVSTAIEGYRQAIRFEPNNWIAHEFLGLAFVEQRQYARAQQAFAEVLLTKPDDGDALQRMMAASYLSGDAATACAMADRIAMLAVQPSRRFLHASVSVYAACAEFQKADAQRQAYKVSGATSQELARLDQRVASWGVFHKNRSEQLNLVGTPSDRARGPTMTNTQFSQQGVFPQQGGFEGSNGLGFPAGLAGGQFGGNGLGRSQIGESLVATSATAPSSGDTRMVLVDVVMVRTEDSISSTKGINLLGALNLQFGSLASETPAFSRNFNQVSGPSGIEATTVLTRAITIPALAYSLNIANATSNLNEVLARPTLAALEGMRSEFFSGTSLNAAVVSGGSGVLGSAVSIEKRYGVKLTVLPQILPNGMIKLAIDASRTFLKPPSPDIAFTYKLEISEILANANVVMRMGDTLILGGLSEKETTGNRDGVPVLQDVPVAQYLFSRKSNTDYQKSVLILITPRPANYTWLSDASKAEYAKNPDDPYTPSMDVLRARYSDWFKPYPNLASVFHQLNAADLYREFRTGDVTLETWDRMDSTRSRLRQALGFLYF
jgi:pilus assembly protein CpaC